MPQKISNRRNRMPYRYRKRQYRRNRPYGNRYGAGAIIKQPKYYSPPVIGGFANKQLVALKYSEDVELPTGAISYYTYVFRGNSLYDPNQTGTGAQPSGLGIWSTVYNKYSVYKSTIKVTFCNQSDNHMTCYVMPYLQSGTTPVNPSFYDEQAGAKNVIIEPYGAGGSIKTIRHSRYTRTMLNVDPFSSDTSIAFNTNPTYNWFWHVAVDTVNGTTTNSVIIKVEIIYYCIMSERKTLA